jgi:exosortase/archaeosortase family protein
MSTGSIPLTSVIRDTRRDWQQRWVSAHPATRTRVQLAVFVVAVLIAFHYSLVTLFENLDVNTPLAYVGLVPAIALGLAAVRRHPARGELSIHDRQLDYIIGLPLIGGALALELIVPSHLSTLFWLWRVDLLGLPLFVAGAVALLFGTRVLWRQKFAIAYLFLAWPLPYTDVLARVLGAFTSLTLASLRHLTNVIPVAHPVAGSDGSLFQVTHAGHPFQLSVVSACSGVDGIVGFALVGLAFGAVVRGPRLRKGLWLAGGMLLLWLINLARIIFVFWTGQQWGENFAINVLHPFIGLLTFNIGVVLMLLALRPMGLQVGWSQAPSPSADIHTKNAKPALAVPSLFAATAVLAVTALVLGVNNSHLRQYDLVANAVGEPKLASYSLDPAAPTGWQASFDAEFTWAKAYFGGSSTWLRFIYQPVAGTGGDLHASLPGTADVINSSNLSSFSAYGVQACYRFHGYALRDVAQVSLGSGITGQAMSFETAHTGDWSIVWWIWPIQSGNSTRYERIILYIENTVGTVVTGPAVPGLVNLQGSLNPANANDQRLIAERYFLVQFGREVVRAQARIQPGSQAPGLLDELVAAGAATPPNAPSAAQQAQVDAAALAQLNRQRATSYLKRHGHPQPQASSN